MLTQIPVIDFILLLLLNMGLGALGIFPSVLLTALNINSFGVTLGTVLSLAGEIFGAIAGFYLYRFGFSKIDPHWLKKPFWQYLQRSSGSRVLWAVIGLRLIPFVPSGFVTAGAALTSISAPLFMIASTIGKIPAVILEVAVVYGVTLTVPPSYQYAIAIGILILTGLVWNKNRRRNSDATEK
ncbi:TVP38/TMEM64 family protein [Planococcus sp. CAU13]|uniref:TVP38/TMEM64 family protein n=1 Tax=Planococcus sp. CAU13 TaxID=1541197 RepID=UPI00052FFDA4|nr:VTT domain-containing protein [Planococcus sp. CAU13]